MSKPLLGILLFFSAVLPCFSQTGGLPPQGTTVPPVGNAQIGSCRESTCRNAPIRENLSAIDLPWRYARAILGGFRQGSGIGGGIQLTTADAIRHVEFRATALTSTRFYERYELGAVAYDVLDTGNHLDVWFSYVHRKEDNFFGIGPDTAEEPETNFAVEQRSYQGTFTHDFTEHTQAGVYGALANARASRGKNEDEIPIDQLFPGIPGLLSNAEIVSYGTFFEYDARDNASGLTRGANIYGRVASADGRSEGDYGWLEAELDARGYLPLGGNKTSLALRMRGNFKDPKGGSDIPFYALSWLGGREYVRGYSTYRFRANHSLLGSVELRQTVHSMDPQRGIDVFGFGDAGQVWEDDVISSNWRSSAGGGIQYRHSDSIAGRFEVAHSNEGTTMYLSLSRGF